MSDLFGDKLAAWQAYTQEPWSRIRYAVVAETLRRQVAELAPDGERLRILDVGGGDGRDSLPLALAGHDVTILDPAEEWLAEAERRATVAGTEVATLAGGLDDLPDAVSAGYDLVLCHFVLRYRPAPDGRTTGPTDAERLATVLRPGGRLSLIDANPAALVLMRLTRRGPDAALAELRAATSHTVTFDHDTRKYPREDAEAELAAAGLRLLAGYGARIANDVVTDDEAKRDPAYFQRLLDLELALCDREPFCRIGGLWQLVAERPMRGGSDCPGPGVAAL